MNDEGEGSVTRWIRDVTAGDIDEVDRICDQFERAWRTGQRPRIEAHLADVPQAVRPALLRELLVLELELRLGGGEMPTPREYGERFPDHAALIEAAFRERIASGPWADGTPDPRTLADADPSARLQLLGEIARGGMGAVFKGRDHVIGRELAIKILLEQHRGRPELIRRFIEEAQIAGQLQHPGIVPVYELGTFADRRPFFTMKLVKGRTLADVLAARPDPTSDQPRVLGIFLQVCQTVAYAHARGVIHRDLKPSNVMVGGFGEVQVMDWGLAKVLPKGGAVDDAAAGELDDQETIIATARSGSDSHLSHAGSVLGTPAYMAPEQARGEIDRVDERADVFALGSMLCKILTGRPAFVGRSSREIQRKAALGDLADAFARLDACGADTELIELARACLAAEREGRLPDVGAVISWLSSHLAGVQDRLRAAELARATESARAEEARRTAAAAEARAKAERRARRTTASLAASLLALTILGGLTYSYISHQRQARAAAVDRLVGRAATLLDQGWIKPAPSPTTRAAGARSWRRCSRSRTIPAVWLPRRVLGSSGSRTRPRRAFRPPSATRRSAGRWSRSAPTSRMPASRPPTRPTARRSAPPSWTSMPSTWPRPAPGCGGGPRRWSSSWPRTSTIGRACAARRSGRRRRGGSRWTWPAPPTLTTFATSSAPGWRPTT
jgi:serine/threonine protein kinase